MGWKKSSDALAEAEKACTEARRTYGEDSPQAQAADEKAFDASDSHFGTYGNPNDRFRG